MKKWLKKLVILIFFALCSYWIYNVIYNLYFSPIYKLETNVKVETINGTTYALHRLSHSGTTYLSEPLSNANQYQLGEQVGRTDDGMQIYQVKGDNTRLIMKGFMSPPEVYRKIGSD